MSIFSRLHWSSAIAAIAGGIGAAYNVAHVVTEQAQKVTTDPVLSHFVPPKVSAAVAVAVAAVGAAGAVGQALTKPVTQLKAPADSTASDGAGVQQIMDAVRREPPPAT